MISPKDSYAAKAAALLEKENLFSAEEISLIEDYLCGEAGDEALAEIGYRDLSEAAQPLAVNNIYMNMLEKGMLDEAKRLEDLLFAAGEASCYKMFSLLTYRSKEHCIMLEPAKKAAVYASLMSQSINELKTYHLEKLIADAQEKPEHLKKAMEYQGVSFSGMFILLTAYFYVKYPEVREGMALEEEDVSLMMQYEELIADSLPRIYPSGFSQQDADVIVSAVLKDRVDDRILRLAGRSVNTDRFFLKLLVGTAFVNHELSVVLKNAVSICLSANWELALNYIDEMDLRGGISRSADHFAEMFHMDNRKFIQWAAEHKKLQVLMKQFGSHQEVFMECMDSADYDTAYQLMANVVKKKDPDLFRKRTAGEIGRQQSKLIDVFVRSAYSQSAMNDIRKYLSGEGGIEHVYACKDILIQDYQWSMRVRNALESYQASYGYDALHNRCETLLLAAHGFSLYRDFLDNRRKVMEDEVKRVFAAADSEGLNLACQLDGYAYIVEYDYDLEWTNGFEEAALGIFRRYLEERREEMLSAFQGAGRLGRRFGLIVLAEHADENKDIILSFAQDSTKSVRERLLDILYGQKNWNKEIIGLLSAKKAAERETAIRVLARWRDEAAQAGNEISVMSLEECSRILTQALEAEKNGKVRALLESVLHIDEETAQGSRGGSLDELVKELHKGNKKRSLAWAYETPFSKVHKQDGTEADEAYLQAIFLCYCAMSPCGVNQSAAALAKDLDEREFGVYVNELFDKWMAAGAEAKKRWVLYASAIHGGDDIVKKLHYHIQEWPQEARGAIASEAVQALALSPRPQGLLIVDGISRKFKFKQVKAAAVKALEFAASQLGITTEELADRIVPNLGFNENMQRIFDYGERKFTVAITPALEIEVFDENGKKLKNLPAPGKKDDEAKAAAAYEEFKQMKKQMKTTVSSQKMRLEMALSTERRWSVQAWKDLFVKNPIMHQFAIGLIWGVYEDRKLVSSFRYMEDGSFNTEEEEEFTLPEDVQSADHDRQAGEGQSAGEGQVIGRGQFVGRGQFIGLVHPIELSEELLKTWKEQLEDYEIVQPIEQLERPVYYRTEEEGSLKEVDRFGGIIVNDLSLSGKMTAQGWYRGETEDGGGFFTFYREDKELGLGAVLYFSGTYVGGLNEDVTVYEIRFFKSGNLSTWSYDSEVETKSCLLSEVPERYFSEIVLQAAKATAAGRERDENWKKKR